MQIKVVEIKNIFTLIYNKEEKKNQRRELRE